MRLPLSHDNCEYKAIFNMVTVLTKLAPELVCCGKKNLISLSLFFVSPNH